MTEKTKLLFVDDDEAVRNLFVKAAKDDDLLIETASNARHALEKLKNFSADIVMTDVRMPQMDGFALMEEIRHRYPETFVVMVTGQGKVEDAVAAMKAGAYDYILKPFDFEMISILIKTITGHKKVLQEVGYQGMERRKGHRFENIIGRDPKMYMLFEQVRDVANTDATVLITGESGTGKELIAEAIHYCSQRKDGPLVRVNCAALTETLINSELFGHERGAFTGAVNQKKGHFELANKGTIFLDEIGDIPISTQISLLRVLELGTYQRVGGTKTLRVDTRFVSATHKDLTHAVREKRFREDLYYRINVVPIQIPPLRERRSDIPLLANYYLKKYCSKIGKDIKSISRSTMDLITRYPWPGNVRELSNAIETAVIFCKGKEIIPKNMMNKLEEIGHPEEFTLRLSSASLPDAESTLICKVLEETNWNLKQAARKLDIARGTLYSKIKKYGIETPL